MYLFIFEDGSLKQSQEPPNREDLMEIADGYLQVVSARLVEYERDAAAFGKVYLKDIPDATPNSARLRQGAGSEDSGQADRLPDSP